VGKEVAPMLPQKKSPPLPQNVQSFGEKNETPLIWVGDKKCSLILANLKHPFDI